MTGSDAALLLRDFVNTLNVETSADEIDTADGLGTWLAERGLLPAGRLGPGDDALTTALILREGLREVLLGHHGPTAGADGPGLADVLRRLPLCVSLTVDGPVLLPVHDGVPGALALLAAAIQDAAADGSWRRLKVCPEDTCRWAFLDTSKNRSRTWCSMRVCGNRTKTRAYRARRRPVAP
ncbi:CGNR zinc finger domain-containing protein [Thermomonospora umbrina]|uniref:Putative RNA-binding Zn ribbon-like protein n=1 Tax=Thermomonospora umbrina TaxID=111806 RepID=A0A3D9SYW1_9ACTN|nr:CGNR zinc finger domain-containing protein [Thermomonospora umbrina]REE99223.1 putative RNA-binding Zn ribbon-like protein [Thermomonospora umbrina]